MAIAQSIIEAAYSRSTANDPGKLATDGELLGVLDRVFQWLYALRAAADPASATSLQSIALAGAPAALTLPTDIIDIRRITLSATGAKVNVIPLEELDRGWHLAPAVYRQGTQIISRGAVGDPAAGASLNIYLLDAPASLVALTTALDVRFPVRFHELLVLILAMYLASKDSGRNAAEFQALKTQYDMSLEMFFRLSGLSLTALQSPHGGVIVQRINDLIKAGQAAA